MELRNIDLETFFDEFIQNGWDDVKYWGDMSDDDLSELGLKAGHIKRFRRYIKDVKKLNRQKTQCERHESFAADEPV